MIPTHNYLGLHHSNCTMNVILVCVVPSVNPPRLYYPWQRIREEKREERRRRELEKKRLREEEKRKRREEERRKRKEVEKQKKLAEKEIKIKVRFRCHQNHRMCESFQINFNYFFMCRDYMCNWAFKLSNHSIILLGVLFSNIWRKVMFHIFLHFQLTL